MGNGELLGDSSTIKNIWIKDNMKVTAQSHNGQNQNKTTTSYVLNNPTIDRLLNRINLLSYKLCPAQSW